MYAESIRLFIYTEFKRWKLMQFLMNIDNSILHFISVDLKNGFFDFIMPKITMLDNHGEIWLLLAVVLILLSNKKYKRIGITVLIALFLGLVFGQELIKNIVHRARPVSNLNGYKMMIPIPKDYSFPSGHSASSFEALGVVWASKIKLRYFVLVMAVAIAFSRMYLHVHYPSDVLGGIILGLFFAFVAIKITKRIFKGDGEINE